MVFSVANRSVLISSPGILLLTFENKVGRVTVRTSEDFGTVEVPFRIMMTLCQLERTRHQELQLPPMCALPELPPTHTHKLLCTYGNVSKINQENSDAGFLFQTLTEQVFSQVESITDDFNGADNPKVVVKRGEVQNHSEAPCSGPDLQALPVRFASWPHPTEVCLFLT